MKFKFCYLSHKLWCYKGIFGPEKSRNNTREKTFRAARECQNPCVCHRNVTRPKVRQTRANKSCGYISLYNLQCNAKEPAEE